MSCLLCEEAQPWPSVAWSSWLYPPGADFDSRKYAINRNTSQGLFQKSSNVTTARRCDQRVLNVTMTALVTFVGKTVTMVTLYQSNGFKPKRKSRASGFFCTLLSSFFTRLSVFPATFSSEERREKRIGSFSLCEKHFVVL